MLAYTNKWSPPLRLADRRLGRRRLASLSRLGFVGAVLYLDSPLARAEAGTPGTSTPRAHLRPLATDRPDKTESPFTVEAGHVQVELDLFHYVHDRESSDRAAVTREEWGLGPVLVKLGVRHNLDVHLGVEPYGETRVTERTNGTVRVTRRQGFGPITLRSKLNLWGNDGGRTALALLPGIQVPTHQDGPGSDEVEAGLAIPFGLTLTDRLELGAQTGAGWVGDTDGHGHHFEVVNSITLGVGLSRRFSGYVEFWTLLDPDAAAEWQGTFDFGLNFLVNDNLKLDVGLNVGVTETAPDWKPFFGLSWRR